MSIPTASRGINNPPWKEKEESGKGTNSIYYKTEPGRISVHLMVVMAIILNRPHKFQAKPALYPIAETITHPRHLVLAPRPEAVKTPSAAIT